MNDITNSLGEKFMKTKIVAVAICSFILLITINSGCFEEEGTIKRIGR
jgi:hypothetical protein